MQLVAECHFYVFVLLSVICAFNLSFGALLAIFIFFPALTSVGEAST
jgi:hypothetical protein